MATKDGKVMQFVATPVGSGYSVEAQISGKRGYCWSTVRIIPTKRNPMQIVIKTLPGKRIPLQVEACMKIEKHQAPYHNAAKASQLTYNVLSSMERDLKMVRKSFL